MKAVCVCSPVCPQTLFGLASCSKAYLAASVGILIDDFAHGRNATPLSAHLARLDWDSKVADVLPAELGWALQEPDGSGTDGWATRKASIKDILGHVSGLPRHDYAYARGDTPESVARRMKTLRTAYELREQWSYNNQVSHVYLCCRIRWVGTVHARSSLKISGYSMLKEVSRVRLTLLCPI